MKHGNLLHFRILGKIGEGGQGTVYKALDTKLGRTVAIKILPPEVTAKDAGLKRFEREARLASSLDHPNICTIFDFYSVDGVNFIVMQYIEGQNIRQLLDGRPLELRSTLSIAIQLTDALAAAHRQGIIHRDIKPGNVLVTESGQVKILDFGLAKLSDDAVAQSQGIHQTHLTEMGVPYGTASSAAPEQATGERVDHRADVFSAGVLLYELLTGIWPFQGKSTVEVRYAVLHHAPVPLAEKLGENNPVLERLQQVLDRSMAKDPDDRYQTVAEMRDELRAILREVDPEASQGIAVSTIPPARKFGSHSSGMPRKKFIYPIAALVLLAFVGAGLWFYHSRNTSPEIRSLAVLPFTNVTADPSSEYLSDGITESLINSLSQLHSVKVRSRNSVFRYKGQQTSPSKIGRELDVAAILTGTVEKRGDDLSINVELINARDDSHLWGDRYERHISDLPRLQEELSRVITDKLRVQLTGEQQKQLVKDYNTNPEAFQIYLQGRFQWNKRTPEGLQQAAQLFKQSIQKDPNYAPAYSGLADCFWLLNVYNVAPATENLGDARDAAMRALQLDPSSAEAHASLGSILYRYDWKWKEAESEFKRAIELQPDYASAHQWYSAMLAAEGRFDESISEAGRAHEIDPVSLTINSDLGKHLYYARRYDQALDIHKKTLAVENSFSRGHIEEADVLVQIGRPKDAIEEYQRALSLDPDSVAAMSGLGYARAVSGDLKGAEEIIQRLKDEGSKHYLSQYYLAIVYAGMGNRDQALECLTRAVEEHFNWDVFINVEPRFDKLRSDPKFIEMAHRISGQP